MKIFYIDRISGRLNEEKVYGRAFLELLYGTGGFPRSITTVILFLITHVLWFSHLYGWLQKRKRSRKKIVPFVTAFNVDVSEFELPLESFSSFNDFFIRKLKKSVRPIEKSPSILIMPADGRYLVFPKISLTEGFWIKGKRLCVRDLLQEDLLASRYEEGSLAIIRLCPVDYHRFHFPCDGQVGSPRHLRGPLYSVSPIALAAHIGILTHNQRVITEIVSPRFGKIQYVEVGATYVGSIRQTFVGSSCVKGEEKGYFEFGGSCLLLLFEPGKVIFDEDLCKATLQKVEVLGKLGMPLGVSCK